MLTQSTRFLVVALAVAFAAALARGETIELRSGGTIVGTVKLEGSDDVVIESVYPSTEVRRLKRSDLAPESMHALLERTADPADAAKRREMGEFAEANGLLTVAAADFTLAKKLDPACAKDMDARIARLREQVAGEMLSDAEDLLAGGHPNAALMYLHSVREKFPGTDAAKKADVVAAAAHKAAGASVEVAVKTVAFTEAPRVATDVEMHVAKGDAERARVGGHVGSTVAEQRSAERAITHYEAAWELVKTLPVSPTGDEKLDARIIHLRDATKTTLVDAYLTAGTILIERRAIAGAERFCNSACELDPDNKDNHKLHALILEAKTLRYGGGSGGSR